MGLANGPQLSDRLVMVRPNYMVPAIPQKTLDAVFRHEQIDYKVELVCLIFEYWNSSGAPRRMVLAETLRVLENAIDLTNVEYLIALLQRRGVAADFFSLSFSSIDRDRKFISFLQANNISLPVISYYSNFYGIDPKAFTDGFFLGVKDSVAVVVFDLIDLVKLLHRMDQEFWRAMLIAPFDPSVSLNILEGQINFVVDLFKALLKQLDPTTIPSRILETWNKWNEEFAARLEALDAYGAGRVLGRIAGDLWQLLTGIIALGKLLGIGIKLARQYAPLLLNTVRKIASEAAIVIREIAALLTSITKTVIDNLVQVGLDMLRILFPPEVLQRAFHLGSALVAWEGWSFCMLPQNAYALAYGIKMQSEFAVVVSHGNRPLFMATSSESAISKLERLVTQGQRSGSSVKQGEKFLADAEADIDRMLDEFEKSLKGGEVSTRMTPSRAEVAEAIARLLKQRLDVVLKDLAIKTARDIFRKLRSQKAGKVTPVLLGRETHEAIAKAIHETVAATAPEMKLISERTMRTAIADVIRLEPSLERTQKYAAALLDQPVHKFLQARPKLLQAMGTEARSAEEVLKYVQERFGWNAKTLAGDLKSDVLLFDPERKGVWNIDFTSPTNFERFEKAWQKLLQEELSTGKDKGKLTGDWSDLVGVYEKKFKGEIPADVKKILEDLRWHADRETVVRYEILREIFENEDIHWGVTSREIFYESLYSLFKAKKD